MKRLIIVLSAVGLCSCSPPGGGTGSATLAEQLEQGKNLYEQTCAQCHYDGSGGPLAPPLRGSDVLAQPPQALARVILGGRQGETMVGNKKFNGVMPPQLYLSDEEVASIVAYVREAYASRREKVPLEVVAEAREAVKNKP